MARLFPCLHLIHRHAGIVPAAPQPSAPCRPAALLLSTNMASQQGPHSGRFPTSAQEASSRSTHTPTPPVGSREGAGPQLNAGLDPPHCLKCNTQLAWQYMGVWHTSWEDLPLGGGGGVSLQVGEVSLRCLQRRGRQNPEPHHSGTGRYKRKQLRRHHVAAINSGISGKFKGNEVSLALKLIKE